MRKGRQRIQPIRQIPENVKGKRSGKKTKNESVKMNSYIAMIAIAAIGGIIWISEPLTWRFSIASVIVLGGVALATLQFSSDKSGPN